MLKENIMLFGTHFQSDIVSSSDNFLIAYKLHKTT